MKQPQKDFIKKVQALVGERSATHGNFELGAPMAQGMKHMMREAPYWNDLYPEQQRALDMICEKLTRAVWGDVTCTDHWRDIAGYADLGLEAAWHRESVAYVFLGKSFFVGAGLDWVLRSNQKGVRDWSMHFEGVLRSIEVILWLAPKSMEAWHGIIVMAGRAIEQCRKEGGAA